MISTSCKALSTLRSIITFERWNASVALMRTRSVSRPNSGSSRGPGNSGNSGSSGAQQYLSGGLRGPGFWEKGGEKYLKKNLIRTNRVYLFVNYCYQNWHCYFKRSFNIAMSAAAQPCFWEKMVLNCFFLYRHLMNQIQMIKAYRWILMVF